MSDTGEFAANQTSTALSPDQASRLRAAAGLLRQATPGSQPNVGTHGAMVLPDWPCQESTVYYVEWESGRIYSCPTSWGSAGLAELYLRDDTQRRSNRAFVTSQDPTDAA